ncbi:patatin-like phospholipase family protein [Flavobacteriaceae bacterium F08102]|nr:patatin-like phospholipase family protein [Flavobacteriaceae bacterium F08102]
MKALVISGGGSKGAFAGGVAQYLIDEKDNDYDIFVGTSTGSLMVSHLALGKLYELKAIYTTVNQRKIFSNNPFKISVINGERVARINHFNTVWNFLNKRKTFGESKNLRKFIKRYFTEAYFNTLKASKKDVVVTVSNFTTNAVEYKSIKECTYVDFCDWIWASCNYVPFMSLMKKNGCEYADGGFGSIVPIREAILRGATEVDAIILETEVNQMKRPETTNPFSLITNIFSFMLDNIERQNVTIGKLEAVHRNVKLNLYYTPTVLTTNSLVFDKKLMSQWWKDGLNHAREKQLAMNKLKDR